MEIQGPSSIIIKNFKELLLCDLHDGIRGVSAAPGRRFDPLPGTVDERTPHCRGCGVDPNRGSDLILAWEFRRPPGGQKRRKEFHDDAGRIFNQACPCPPKARVLTLVTASSRHEGAPDGVTIPLCGLRCLWCHEPCSRPVSRELPRPPRGLAFLSKGLS